MQHYVVSDLGLHCLPMTLLWVSRKEGVKYVHLISPSLNLSMFITYNVEHWFLTFDMKKSMEGIVSQVSAVSQNTSKP